MTGATLSVSPDDGDEHILDRVPCRCGRLAAVVMDEDDGDVGVSIHCACGSFSVADAEERR